MSYCWHFIQLYLSFVQFAAVGGRKFNHLWYADDTLIIAEDEHKLINILHGLDEHSRRYGLDINKSQTKVMIVNCDNNNSLALKMSLVSKLQITLNILDLSSSILRDQQRNSLISGRTLPSQLSPNYGLYELSGENLQNAIHHAQERILDANN